MTKVLCHGCFDILHYGHVYHLQYAKSLGYVIVALTSDKSVEKQKGKPLFNQNIRKKMLESIKYVDKVIIVDSAEEAIRRVKPDYYVKGADVKDKVPLREKLLVEKYNGKLVFSPDKYIFHSSNIRRS